LSLAQTLLTWAYSCYRGGELSKGVDIALEGILVAQGLVEGKEELSEAWKLIGDAVFLGSLVQVDGSHELLKIASQILGIPNGDDNTVVNDEDIESEDAEEIAEEAGTRTKLLRCNVAAMEKMVNLTQGDRLAHSAAHFNLGLAKYRLLQSETQDPAISSHPRMLQESNPVRTAKFRVLERSRGRHSPTLLLRFRKSVLSLTADQ